MSTAHQKVDTGHLSRDACLYVRQSSLQQVFDHGESTRRQYALRDRAVALGWPTENIVVIDSDLGLSGADSDREGFQHLVAGVGMGRAGIVLGLEVMPQMSISVASRTVTARSGHTFKSFASRKSPRLLSPGSSRRRAGGI